MVTSERREYMLAYKREKGAKRKQVLLNMLGGKCVNCGTTEKLEFDHIDPKLKSFNIVSKILVRWDRLLDEIKKCQLLCNSCHWDKTRKDRNCNIGHGTPGMYSNHKCRCDLCRKAWSKYVRPKINKWRNERKIATL